MKGKKTVDFFLHPIALGVQFDLERLWTGSLGITIKPGRIAHILEMIKQWPKQSNPRPCDFMMWMLRGSKTLTGFLRTRQLSWKMCCPEMCSFLFCMVSLHSMSMN